MLPTRPPRLPPGPGSSVATGLAGKPADAGAMSASDGCSYPGAKPLIRSLRRLAVTASSLRGAEYPGGGGGGGGTAG